MKIFTWILPVVLLCCSCAGSSGNQAQAAEPEDELAGYIGDITEFKGEKLKGRVKKIAWDYYVIFETGKMSAEPDGSGIALFDDVGRLLEASGAGCIYPGTPTTRQGA